MVKKYSILLICFFVGINFANAANTTLKVLITAPLVLSVKNTTLNISLTGIPRLIVIKNIGSSPATRIVAKSTGLPKWTTIVNKCTAPLEVGKTCNIIIRPGAIASSTCTTGKAPTPGLVSIKASNSKAVKRNVVVLGYGCIYKGGYVYSINDAVKNTLSIRGKVLTTTDIVAPFPGNTWNQAKLKCPQRPTTAGFAKWALPTICDMAPSVAAQFTPKLTAACSLNKQQISKTLPFLIEDSGMNNCTKGSYCFGGPYWSGTSANENMTSAGLAIFEKAGSWGEPTMVQGGSYGVRCSRPF